MVAGKGRRLRFVLCLVGLMTMVAWVSGVVRAGGKPDAASLDNERMVTALGRIEPEAGIVTIAGPPGYRIRSLEVEVGSEVHAGQLLVEMDGLRQREAQFRLAVAQKNAVDFRREQKRAETDLARKQADALRAETLKTQADAVALLQNSLDIAMADLERLEKGGVAKQQTDQQRLFVNSTKGNLLEAKLKLREIELVAQVLPEQRALEDKALGDDNPEWQVAARQVELAEAEWDQTKITAPAKGDVLAILAHEGEVPPGPILYLADTSRMVVIAEVYQSDVRRIAKGDPAEVEILGQKVKGEVKSIGRIVGRNRLFNINPVAPTDRRVVEVTILLEAAAPAAQYVNLEVDVTIRPRAPEKKP